MEKPILDACCGGRTFWFDKHNPHAVYVDKRTMERRIIWTSKDVDLAECEVPVFRCGKIVEKMMGKEARNG